MTRPSTRVRGPPGYAGYEHFVAGTAGRDRRNRAGTRLSQRRASAVRRLFHPRPLPVAVLGDSIASLVQPESGGVADGPSLGRDGSADPCLGADFIGYRGAAGSALPAGIFTSGSTMANASALRWPETPVLGSESRCGAMDMLGMGRRSLRLVPADRTGRIRLDALTDRIAHDRRAGHRPVAIVGMARSASTCATPYTRMGNLVGYERAKSRK